MSKIITPSFQIEPHVANPGFTIKLKIKPYKGLCVTDTMLTRMGLTTPAQRLHGKEDSDGVLVWKTTETAFKMAQKVEETLADQRDKEPALA